MLQPVPLDQGPTSMQRQARALGDPTRYAIFRFVANEEAPVRVASLAEHFQLNHNAVRQHLAKLCDAGLLVEEQAPRSGPGRPALQYRLSPGALATWGTAGPYAQLSMMLLELIRTGRSPREVGADAGRRLRTSSDGRADAIDELEAEMTRRGFDPRRAERGSSVELALQRCPFEAAALADPDVVCQLHLGLAEGIVEGLSGDVEVTGLVARDARRAECRLKLRRGQRLPPGTSSDDLRRPAG